MVDNFFGKNKRVLEVMVKLKNRCDGKYGGKEMCSGVQVLVQKWNNRI